MKQLEDPGLSRRTLKEIYEHCRTVLVGFDVDQQDVYVFASRGKLAAGFSRYGLGMWNLNAFGMNAADLESRADDVSRILSIHRWIMDDHPHPNPAPAHYTPP